MRSRIITVIAIFVIASVALVAIGQKADKLKGRSITSNSATRNGKAMSDEIFSGAKITKSDEAWRKVLSPEAFYVLRKKATERAYTGELTDNKKAGVYVCGACGLHLFSSKDKFDSGTGWPSFFQVIHRENIEEEVDNGLGETRTEVLCKRCGSHLGHVFDDGPQPTGLRYCINSIALKFLPAK